MKNKIYKNSVYPYDIGGYVKLSGHYNKSLVKFLLNKYHSVKNINKSLNFPSYWFNNFIRNEKIHTKDLKKLVSVTGLDIVKNIIQFNDDKGSSSIPYVGKFPIEYDPFWHFVFCLSVGDGHIKSGKKKAFTWYQKPEGQEKLIELLKNHNFIYKSLPNEAKQGITIPQLIRKVGSFVTGLETNKLIRNNIIKKSRELGKDFEIAFLCAFFLDESGMSRSKLNSEITLHQEGNLSLLEKVGNLLNSFSIKWSKNRKGDLWYIRINSEGIVKLPKLFDRLNKYGIDLLHRKEIFKRKVDMANRTLYRIPLRYESNLIRKYLLNNHRNEIISLSEIRNHFKSNFNVSSRSRKLISTMKSKKELKPISLGKYIIGGN